MFRKLRRFKQEISAAECSRVLQEGRRGVLSVRGEDGYPYGMPMNYLYDEETNAIYFHTAKAGHKLDAMAADNRVCFTVMDEGFKKPGDWAWYVNSVIVFGRMEMIADEETARTRVLQLADKYFPPEEDTDADMAKSFHKVQMMKLNIDHMTGKLVHEN